MHDIGQVMATSLLSSSIYLQQLSKFNELSALSILGGNLVSLISGYGRFGFRSLQRSKTVLCFHARFYFD